MAQYQNMVSLQLLCDDSRQNGFVVGNKVVIIRLTLGSFQINLVFKL
jgi:hypothetical protein